MLRSGVGAAESGLFDSRAMTAKEFAAWQISVMVKRISLFRIACFCLCAACGAFCQAAHSKSEHFPSEGPAPASKSSSLPDAPSAMALAQAHPVQNIGVEVRSPLAVTALDVAAVGVPSATARFQAALIQQPDQRPDQQRGAFFFKHLYASPSSPNPRSRASDNESVVGRATNAASRILITRDLSGKRRFNTSYFVRVVTSVAADSASRKYRARSDMAPLSDFGSTVGNDAGMNLLHEFGPDLQAMVTSHLPKFVSRIEERITH
jgi:hypothetical protein